MLHKICGPELGECVEGMCRGGACRGCGCVGVSRELWDRCKSAWLCVIGWVEVYGVGKFRVGSESVGEV